MSISTKTLVECVNANIACATVCTPLQVAQLSSVSKDFDAGFVYSVANCAALPSAACNKGRLIYLNDVEGYRISDGTTWTNDFTSTQAAGTGALAWGYNNKGQLGDGTSGGGTHKSSPVSVVGGFTDWCQVSAGNNFSLGVRTNGTAWAWGSNNYGQLGDCTGGVGTSKSSPVSVLGGFTDWCQVSAGGSHSLGLRTNGTAWAWGYNYGGYLGDNTTVAKSSPVSVVGGFTNWCQVSAGRSHSLGLRTNGTAWAWGYNYDGQLGDGTSGVGTTKSSPVSVVGGFTDWCQVSGGWYHSVGVRTNGTAWAWGRGSLGELGNGTITNTCSPVSVIGGFTDWCQIGAGREFSLGLRTNGTAWAWGRNTEGQLGDNTLDNKSSPVSVVGGFTNWCEVSAATNHSFGIRTNGTLWAWGANYTGRLGDGTTLRRCSPVSVVGGFTDWCQVSGGLHSLAIRRSKGF